MIDDVQWVLYLAKCYALQTHSSAQELLCIKYYTALEGFEPMVYTQSMWAGELDGYFRLITSLGFECVGGIKRTPKILGNTTFMKRLIYIIDRQQHCRDL